MPRQLALSVYVLLILWLFVRDRKWRPMTSVALWVPLLWIVIIGSRPVSVWLGVPIDIDSRVTDLEGSPLDRNVYFILIGLGLLVLLKRRLNWGGIFASNFWLFVFFLYCGISVIWSDYSFVSFKRWIKDLGNVVMALVILTEKDPVQAIRAVFARYTNFAIPLSVAFIKYFPDLGRYYHHWTWEAGYCGVGLDKNELGCMVFICGLFLIWDLIKMRTKGGTKTDKPDLFGRVVLLLMVFWLIRLADSQTALLCLILGTGILFFMRPPLCERRAKYLGMCSLAVGLLILLLYSIPGISEGIVGMLGRNMTLTGRTDLWSELLKAPINPLLGEGYQSFWIGPISQRYTHTFWWKPNQAHNGYLQTYLDGGLVGVFLLMTMIVSAGRNLKKVLLLGDTYGILRFSFLITVVIYNWTEAVFNRMNPVWFILLIAALDYPRSPESMAENMAESAKGNLIGASSDRQSKVPVP